MKFLQHGDSVVSLRFLYQEAPSHDYEGVESSELTELSTEAEIALGKINEAEAILDQLETGDTDVEFGAQEWGDLSRLLAIINNEVDGDLNSLSPDSLALYKRIERRFRQVENSGQIPGVYLYGDEETDTPPASSLLPGFGETTEQEIDLNTLAIGVEKEATLLQEEVQQYAEHITTGADTRMEMAELADLVTAEGLSRDAKLTESGKRPPDRPVMTVASTVAELPAKLDQVLASLDEDTASRFGDSAFAAFDAGTAAA